MKQRPKFVAADVRRLVVCVCLMLRAAFGFADELKIELPAETALFKPGRGADLANGQCLVCHAVEYVVMQPPSPRAFWAASVKKMREKFGAQIPPDVVEPLVDYLARNYGTETNNAQVAPANMPSSPPTTGVEAVLTKYGCLLCHNVDVKIVGPPYKAIADKYHNDPTGPAKIAEQIHNGGSGKWGSVPMPPFPMVSEAETKALADWVLSRR